MDSGPELFACYLRLIRRHPLAYLGNRCEVAANLLGVRRNLGEVYVQDRSGAWGGREWAIENRRLSHGFAARVLAAHGYVVSESVLRHLFRPWLMGIVTLACLAATFRLKSTTVKLSRALCLVGMVYYLPFFIFTHSCQYRYYFPTFVLWVLSSISLGSTLWRLRWSRTAPSGAKEAESCLV